MCACECWTRLVCLFWAMWKTRNGEQDPKWVPQYILRYEMHTKNICGKGREWLIRLNNNNYTNKMKSYFLFPCIYLSVAASDTLLVPMKRQSYSSMNIHSPRLLNPDFLKTNLSLLLSIMYSELAFYLWIVKL